MAQRDFAVMRTGEGDRFRILQVTDFHSDAAEYCNERTREDVRALVAAHGPDLLAVTGDIWCGDLHPGAALMWMKRDLDFLASLETPWAFCRGNHDYVSDLEYMLGAIAETPHAIAPAGDSKGNFRIELQTLGEEVLWDIFFLDSGPRWNEVDSLDWFTGEVERVNARRGRVVPALLFFHIPLRNYQEALDTGRIRGAGNEDVLFWGDEDGRVEEVLKAAGQKDGGPGNVRACFCGHSHKNDFHFEEDGIVFGYGRATGYGGYGGEEIGKGAKLIELGRGRDAITWRTVFASDADVMAAARRQNGAVYPGTGP